MPTPVNCKISLFGPIEKINTKIDKKKNNMLVRISLKFLRDM